MFNYIVLQLYHSFEWVIQCVSCHWVQNLLISWRCLVLRENVGLKLMGTPSYLWSFLGDTFLPEESFLVDVGCLSQSLLFSMYTRLSSIVYLSFLRTLSSWLCMRTINYIGRWCSEYSDSVYTHSPLSHVTLSSKKKKSSHNSR